MPDADEPDHRNPPAPGGNDRLFAPLPVDGFWTSLGLGRGQFFGILLASCLLFLLWDGPLWQDPRGGHFGRLAGSYALIPALVAAALARNGQLRPALLLGASAMIAVFKLVVTAGIDLVIGLAVPPR